MTTPIASLQNFIPFLALACATLSSTSAHAIDLSCFERVKAARSDFYSDTVQRICNARKTLAPDSDETYTACVVSAATLSYDPDFVIDSCRDGYFNQKPACWEQLGVANTSLYSDARKRVCNARGVIKTYGSHVYTACVVKAAAITSDTDFMIDACLSQKFNGLAPCWERLGTVRTDFYSDTRKHLCSGNGAIDPVHSEDYVQCVLRVSRSSSDNPFIIKTCLAEASGPSFVNQVRTDNLPKVFTSIAAQVYSQRAVFLNGIANSISATAPATTPLEAMDQEAGRIFTVAALDPFMNRIETKWFQDKVAPIWSRDVAALKQSNGVSSLRDIFPTPSVARNAVAILHAGFEAAKSSLGDPGAIRAIATIQHALGHAGASTLRPRTTAMSELVTVLECNSAVIATLQGNARSAAIGDTMASVVEYLKTNY